MDKKNLVLFFVVLAVVSAGLISWLGKTFVLSVPFIWIFIAGSVSWFIFFYLSKGGVGKPSVFLPDRYRPYFTIALTIIVLLSNMLLSSKTVMTGRMPNGVSRSIILRIEAHYE